MASSKVTTSPTFTASDVEMMAPFASSDDKWGWTHYGFYVLDLPAPWGYLNANTVIGTAGSHTFNRRPAEQRNPTDCRRDSSLHISTGGSQESTSGWHYSIYDTADPLQAQLAEDGRKLKWTRRGGRENLEETGVFEVEQSFPDFHLRGKWKDWQFSLKLSMTQVPAVVTHFARLKKQYEHFSLMAAAEGWIQFQDGRRIVSPASKWPANIEYARSITPQMLSPTRLPAHKMVPDTMFTYQIMTVSSPASSDSADNFQILIARTGRRQKANVSLLWLRSSKHPEQNATFLASMNVLRYKRVATPGGDAETAVVPAEIEWIVHDPASSPKGSKVILKLRVFPGEGQTGNLWRGRFGSGFNTGCEWTGTYRGIDLLNKDSSSQKGRGHVEWVDVEASEQDLAVRGPPQSGSSKL